MQYSIPILLDHRGNPLTGDSNPMPDVVQGINALEEAWTPQKLANTNKDYIDLSNVGGLSFDLVGTWRYIKGLYFFRGPVRNVVNNLAMLTGAPEVTFESDSDDRQWKDIASENGFPNRWSAIIRHTYLYNDYFTAVFRGGRGRIQGTGSSRVAIRNFEPFHIEKIEHEAGDPESVTGYKVYDAETRYGPDEIVHHIVDRVGNDMRGVPILNSCLRELTYFYKSMEDLYYLVHMRARIPLVRKVKGGQIATAAEAARFDYLPGPGRFAVENEGVEWQYPPAYGGLSDVPALLNEYIKAVASAVNLPVFLVSSDYTNNSLASTLSADSPTVRNIRWNREQFDAQFKEIVQRAMGRDVEPHIDWPPVIERNLKQDAEAYQIGITNGAVSAQTMSTEVFGRNWDEEKARIEQEAADAQRHAGLGQNESPPDMFPDDGGGA